LEVKMVEKLNLEGPNWWPPDSSTPNSSRKMHCLLFLNKNLGRARPSRALGSSKCRGPFTFLFFYFFYIIFFFLFYSLLKINFLPLLQRINHYFKESSYNEEVIIFYDFDFFIFNVKINYFCKK
jgi:hypothetical protein